MAGFIVRDLGLTTDRMKKEMEMDNKVWDIPDDGSPVFGNTKNPKLTIVEFTEFQCPYCSRIAPEIKKLMINAGVKGIILTYGTLFDREGMIKELRPRTQKEYEDLMIDESEIFDNEIATDNLMNNKDIIDE